MAHKMHVAQQSCVMHTEIFTPPPGHLPLGWKKERLGILMPPLLPPPQNSLLHSQAKKLEEGRGGEQNTVSQLRFWCSDGPGNFPVSFQALPFATAFGAMTKCLPQHFKAQEISLQHPRTCKPKIWEAREKFPQGGDGSDCQSPLLPEKTRKQCSPTHPPSQMQAILEPDPLLGLQSQSLMAYLTVSVVHFWSNH